MTAVNPAHESEKTLIGALLLDSTTFEVIKDMLCINDFFDETFQKIFLSICEVQHKRGTYDIAMVSDHGQLNINYLCALANECCSTANVLAHAQIIREKSVQRQLQECANELNEQDIEQKDLMEKDFSAFQFIIQPSLHDDSDAINLILVVLHIETDINTNALIDGEKLRQFGMGYLFGLMQELVHILKTKLGYVDHLE